MSRIVMKFGGSSVGSVERIRLVADKIAERRGAGNECIVVLSAMGDTTDDLIDLAKQLNERPSAREMDMLLTTGEQVSVALMTMRLHAIGVDAVSLTGWQAGMRTNGVHGRARISEVDPARILEGLEKGRVVVVAGFQGITKDGEITTLGRGGSDTTAVALAAAVGADLCEIYTDVDGVYSTDPRIVRKARKLGEISYDEMLELAHLGAAVLDPRAVEYAKQFNVPLVVRSSFTWQEGTVVKEDAGMEQGAVVRGIAHDKNVGKISIFGAEDRPGTLAKVFTALAKELIDVDMIVQSGVKDGKADFSFTVKMEDLEKAVGVVKDLQEDIGFDEVAEETGLVKVSIVGAAMVSHPGVAAKMFDVIFGQGVNIKLVSTSEIKISCLIEPEKVNEVIQALHTAFGLDATSEVFVGGPKERR